MRIRRTLVKNFRGVRSSELGDLQDLVVLAGQNGSGKSCVLDAIRLVKSVYGGYQQNEFHHWFGEFQINFSNDPRAFRSLFNDGSQPLIIEIDVEPHSDEISYLKENAESLVTAQAWRAVVPELYGWRSLDAAPFTAQFRSREPEVKEHAKRDLELFWAEIDKDYITAGISIAPNDQPKFNPSKVLELIFSTYDLRRFGIIDYHGPHRVYGREVVSNINVNIDAMEEQKKQTTLYNYNAKYGNVKSEMASLYVREALAEKAGKKLSSVSNVTDTLKELFSTFFPEKEFLGPEPVSDGSLRFPVIVGGRESHDLDELSSGEKEILYGYLRLRSSAPRNSVILLDEPELHLNPRLTKNLPAFYHRHLAKALGNQVWLITHSDAILRESVGRADFSVFHITPSAHAREGNNQATRVQADHDLERAVIDLVGDLAAYSPGARVVLFEGEESDFDLRMASELFPELAERANLISGTNKSRVRGLHRLLQNMAEGSKLPEFRVHSITDRDSESEGQSAAVNMHTWNVYHIENYLLESKYITATLIDLKLGHALVTEDWVETELRTCARETITSLIVHALSQKANKAVIGAISTRVRPDSEDAAGDVWKAVESSRSRLDKIMAEDVSVSALTTYENELKNAFSKDVSSDEWRVTFRGRDILKRFVGKHGGGIKYDMFRNLIIARMRDDDFKPAGMKEVIDTIIAPTPLASAASPDG